jgi:hypothetical protein
VKFNAFEVGVYINCTEGSGMMCNVMRSVLEYIGINYMFAFNWCDLCFSVYI